MSKNNQLKKDFQFSFPLSHKVVRDLKIVTEHVGDLIIEGVAVCNPKASALDSLDERYTVDIDYIKWNGVDIKPVLEVVDAVDNIYDAALQHAAKLFTLPRLAQSIASELNDLEEIERRISA